MPQDQAHAAPPPVLRSPPFVFMTPGVPALAERRPAVPGGGDDLTALLEAILGARVGGTFWAPEARTATAATRIVRAADPGHLRAALARLSDGASHLFLLPAARWSRRAALACRRAGAAAIVGEVDPWSVLRPGVRLAATGDDEWLLLAVIAGAEAEPASPGRFAPAAGEPVEALLRRELIAAIGYRDPFTGRPIAPAEAVAQLAEWRALTDRNRAVAVAAGVSWWKRREIGAMLWTARERPLRFARSARRSVALAQAGGGAIAAWPSRMPAGLEAAAAAAGVPIHLIEDGFVRSVGLGSNLLPPWSIVVDRLGLHYDPSRASDLEQILATADFPPALLARAETLAGTLVREGIGKYGRGGRAEAPAGEVRAVRRVLVVGQVEDDLSVQLGGAGVTSNLDLLHRARAAEPGAELWWRPHPDVDAGHRRGAIPDPLALTLAARVVRGGSIAALLDQVDAVHVLTSLTGFEALLRGRDVVVHGQPFYAGWGLTRDLSPPIARRGRPLTVAMLVAGTLVLYSRYRDPVTGLPCRPELVISRIIEGRTARQTWLTRLRRLQGRVRLGIGRMTRP